MCKRGTWYIVSNRCYGECSISWRVRQPGQRRRHILKSVHAFDHAICTRTVLPGLSTHDGLFAPQKIVCSLTQMTPSWHPGTWTNNIPSLSIEANHSVFLAKHQHTAALPPTLAGMACSMAPPMGAAAWVSVSSELSLRPCHLPLLEPNKEHHAVGPFT